MLRTAVDPRRVADDVRHALRALDEDMPIIEMQSMDSLLARSLLEERYRTLVVGLFSALATLIAVVGVAGVAARAISQRMRELGIRAALGATSLQIVQLVCRQGIVPVLAGILSGVACAAAVGRVLQVYLFGVGPGDPATIATAAILLFALSSFALLAQARRAARPDLASLMRAE
jgi:ABC-type antimicrobial peptide transport system permease subunit